MQNSLSSALSRMTLNKKLASNSGRFAISCNFQRVVGITHSHTFSSSKSGFQQGTVLSQSYLGPQGTTISVSKSVVVECKAKQKCKTRKAALKRFKVTGRGKLMHRHPNKQHLNEKTRRKQIVKLGKKSAVLPTDWDNMKKCLPYAKI